MTFAELCFGPVCRYNARFRAAADEWPCRVVFCAADGWDKEGLEGEGD